jgi:L-threonylcarbamoyladenylate synthase
MNSEIVKILKNEGVGIMPTDTIYGLVGSATSRKAVFKIYKLRKRNSRKPFIILIGSLKDLKLFRIKIDGFSRKMLGEVWPNAVSVVLPCAFKKFFYLHRGNKTLAFRFPKNRELAKFLRQTGPLIAPSANPEGFRPAENIEQAKKYFGEGVDFYVDKGTIKGLPSTLIEIKNKKIFILRQGSVKIKI